MKLLNVPIQYFSDADGIADEKAPLSANFHAMIHSTNPALSLRELKNILSERRTVKNGRNTP